MNDAPVHATIDDGKNHFQSLDLRLVARVRTRSVRADNAKLTWNPDAESPETLHSAQP